MLPRGPRIEVWTCFPEVRWIGILDMLPRDPLDWSLDVLPRGPMVWNLGRASQRSKDLNFDGLKFGRASQRSDGLNLDMLPRGPMD